MESRQSTDIPLLKNSVSAKGPDYMRSQDRFLSEALKMKQALNDDKRIKQGSLITKSNQVVAQGQPNKVIDNFINKQLEDQQFSVLKNKLINGEISMNFKSNNVLRRRYAPVDLNRRSSIDINPALEFEEEKYNQEQVAVTLPERSEATIKRKKKKRNSKTVNEVSLAQSPHKPQLEDFKQENIQVEEQIIEQPISQKQTDDKETTLMIDYLNIDLEEENGNLEFRDIEADELKSDFDEIKGLGRPSIDSFTINIPEEYQHQEIVE